jgi:hypothetical protein
MRLSEGLLYEVYEIAAALCRPCQSLSKIISDCALARGYSD